MADEPSKIEVTISNERVRAAVRQALRAQAAGMGVDVASANLFFGEASLLIQELLEGLDFYDTSTATLNELVNRIAHLFVGSTLVGFRALVMLESAMLEGELGELDYTAALSAIEDEIAAAYPDDEPS